jgi:PhnB protein
MDQTTHVQQPPVKGGVVPYLTVDGATKAAEFWARAFGAEIAMAMPPDEKGRSMHVHVYVNGSSIMLSDPFPEQGCTMEKLGGFNLMIMVEDCDAAFQRAVDAGATPVMPPADMFWGDRYAQVRDPFGVLWAINQHRAAA